jgi:threonine/homoserine/homoserine lactone efflux protein
LAPSATAFTIVKYLGAAYLVWLGIQQFRARDVDLTIARDPVPRRRLFTQGVVVNVLNPKTAIFFLAFLPQFADPARGPIPAQLAVLGGVFILLGILSDGAYALAAGFLARPLRTVRFRRRLRYGSGAVYLGLGITAALSQSRAG